MSESSKWRPHKLSAFTPFLRRFTDERARDLDDTKQLYREVRALHLASPYCADDAVLRFVSDIFDGVGKDRAPTEPVVRSAFIALLKLVEQEKTIFEFPDDIDLDTDILSLKQHVDLRRFLRAKQHFLGDSERISAWLSDALYRLFRGILGELPEIGDDTLFTVPLIDAVADPADLVEKIVGTLCDEQYDDTGLFTAFRTTVYENICAINNVVPYTEHKRPFKRIADLTLPPDELVAAYLKGTPLYDFLLTPIPLAVPRETYFSHMHIVGGSGAGKTQWLQTLILHHLDQDDPPALVIVDSQGDLIDKLVHLERFNPRGGELADRLIHITPKDIRHPPAINIFDVHRERVDRYDAAIREQIVAGAIDTFDYLFRGLLADLTAKQSVFFKMVARLMLALPDTLGRNATILDMLELMEDHRPYQRAIAALPNIPRRFFELDFQQPTFRQTKEQIRYRLNAILENPTLERLFTSPSTKVDLFHELNNGSIVLVDTAKDFLKSGSSYFGRIFISLVLQAVLERAAIPENDRRPAFLIVDEAADYFDTNIDDLLTEARKYRLGCVFAHQFLDQCTPQLRASLAANTSIKLAGGVSTADARHLAPDLRTTPDFVLGQERLRFACYIRNVTPRAITLPVTPGLLEREPKLSDDAYRELRARNRGRVSYRPQPGPPPTHTATDPDDVATDASSAWGGSRKSEDDA